MKNSRRLTYKMNGFLLGMRDRLVVLPALLEQEQVEPRLLTRWLRHPVFCDSLHDVVRQTRVRLRLEMELLAACAARELGVLLEQVKRGMTPDPNSIALFKTILEEHHRMRSYRPRRSGGGRPSKRPALEPALADLCHPDAKPYEDELLAVLGAPDEGEEETGETGESGERTGETGESGGRTGETGAAATGYQVGGEGSSIV